MHHSLGCIALLLTGACAASTATVPLDDTVTLEPGRAVRVTDVPARITFVSVRADSRCPADVTCVWAGNAEVVLKVEDDRLPDDTIIVLNTGVEPRSGRVGDLRIELLDVAPDTRSSSPVPASRYRASIILRRVR